MEKPLFYIAKGLRRILRPPAIRSSKIDKSAAVCSGSNVNYSTINRYSYIGNDSFLYYASVGSFSSIGDCCRIGNPSHPMQWVSLSPVFIKGKNILHKNFAELDFTENELTIVGNDVWIGSNVLIKSGVSIGDGAIIGMGSIVTKNVPPYEVWAGNPARFIKKRFPEDIVKSLLNIKWWEWSEEEISQYAHLFNNTDKLIECIKKKGKL